MSKEIPSMPLKEEFENAGNWLFRWRSYLPLLLTGLVLVGLRHYHYPGHSEEMDDIWEIVCMIVSFFGLGIRAYTVGCAPEGTSGRNTRGQKAYVLNTTGIYSIVRHPLYLGNFFIWLGISLFLHVWWVTMIFILVFWIYYERIMFAEEEYLRERFGQEYMDWSTKTPAFLPQFRNWRKPILAFSLKNVLKREYSGFFAIIVVFTFLEITGDMVVEHKIELDKPWTILFSLGLLVYLTLMTLKKRTKLLSVEGR
jgi:protein-S-isoprenylcysteine O-methyltransferase Ste14